jgi:siroheme synthase (precorrin-2 oxidase/ferrochelatase)
MRSGLFILKIALVSTAENIHMASTNKTAVLGGGSVGSTLAKALADADEDVVIAARDPARTAENLAWRNVSGIEGGAGRRRRPGIRVRDHTRDAERPR